MTALTVRLSYAGYRFLAEIISQVVWLHLRLPRRLRMAESISLFAALWAAMKYCSNGAAGLARPSRMGRPSAATSGEKQHLAKVGPKKKV